MASFSEGKVELPKTTRVSNVLRTTRDSGPPSPTTRPGSLYTVQYMCAQLELGGGGEGGYKTMNFYDNNNKSELNKLAMCYKVFFSSYFL